MHEAARVIGLQINVLNASTNQEIDAAFATLARERPDALFLAPDASLTIRSMQITALAARDRIPASYAVRDFVVAGGLMSYGTDMQTVFVKLASIPAKFSMALTRIIHDSTSFSSPRRARAPSTSPDLIRIGV